LTGIQGEASVAGVGLLFLMWNIPYGFAIANPVKYYISLLQAVLMQLMGVVGETIIYLRIPDQSHMLLSGSIKRFIIFDSAGLFFLIVAGFLIIRLKRTAWN